MLSVPQLAWLVNSDLYGARRARASGASSQSVARSAPVRRRRRRLDLNTAQFGNASGVPSIRRAVKHQVGLDNQACRRRLSAAPATVVRRGSNSGVIMVVGQKVELGRRNAVC